MRYVWMISITLISSFLLSGRSRCTVYRSLKSKVLLVLSASPVPFLSKTGFKTPLIVAANKSYWRLDESAKMWGGTLGPDRGKMRVWRKNAHVDMSGRFIRASRRAAGAWRGSCSPNKLFDHPHQLEITTKCCILVLIKVLFRR